MSEQDPSKIEDRIQRLRIRARNYISGAVLSAADFVAGSGVAYYGFAEKNKAVAAIGIGMAVVGAAYGTGSTFEVYLASSEANTLEAATLASQQFIVSPEPQD